MKKQNNEAATSWAWISYSEKQPVREIMPQIVKFSIASPLHSPDFTEEQRAEQIEKLGETYAAKIAKAKNKERIEKLEEELEQKVEEIEQKQLKPHHHYLVQFARRVRPATAEAFKNSLWEFEPEQCDLQTRVERVSDFSSYYRYLFHLDALEKQQFAMDCEPFWVSSEEKFRFYEWKIRRARHLSDKERKENIIWSIAKRIDTYKIKSFASLYNFVNQQARCDEELYELLGIIRTNNAFFARLLAEQNERE